ncbi:MAG: FKBP-type peptidyl-prolyl cis-trans isomerase [Thermoplasmatota archaeon]
MVEKGSLVRVDYEAWTEEGELFDTTVKELARKHEGFREDAVYEPLPIIVGAGRVIPGFDAALERAAVGKEEEVVIPASQAYGDRDPSKIETMSLRKFQERDVDPRPGMRITIDNRPGTVIAVTAGRVRVDFNPPLAGKGLKYKFTVLEQVNDPVAKIRSIVEMDYGLGRGKDFEIDYADGAATIKVPDGCKYDQRWFVLKYRVVADLRTYGGVKTIRFVEEYTSAEPTTGSSEAPSEEVAAPEEEHTHSHATPATHSH